MIYISFFEIYFGDEMSNAKHQLVDLALKLSMPDFFYYLTDQ